MPIISASPEVDTKRIMVSSHTSQKVIKIQYQQINSAGWSTAIIPATWEAQAGGSGQKKTQDPN
jgi:hypothetical protein